MTVFEILKFNREMLERLGRMGVRLDDTRYIDLFSEFCDMVNSGDKVSYAVAVLADRYGVSERKVYSLLRHFRTDCSHDAL
ncbi:MULTISPECIES: hypothetical protein [Muribaculaceae]|jgi:hypothetical protein|uniref:Uncharacterized protein n=1 Tax=Lepagella muris TaxID=3032870 RepID=A0AC61RLR1_9BACT|nr:MULTISPECIES: hypothetical protein [Muribaculaceae]ROS87232.1 hypothetical protein EEL39_10780 [Muribaculaceae bacterium Isolate-080 (Janvier)]ROT01921.1 hypothetical protein EEL33_20345 [Muribaculaceae bacterium Isolate-037 (Harlan)]TGY80236.1 hypothetical protein E5331_03080 [Lepagella muris]THG52775.1 hypothetical protein E5984_05560 [Bacteroidales bacterium]